VARPRLVVVLLVAATLVNVVQFRAIDQHTIDNFDAVHRNDTADLFELSYRECRWCRDRYGLHLALRAIAPGSTVIVPASSRYAASRNQREALTLRLYALGGVTGIEWVDYRQGSQLLSVTGLDPSRYVIASGSGGEKGAPWALAVDLPSREVDRDRFLEDALRDGAHRRSGQPREFILLQWDAPGEDSSYQDLLLETSLLPGSIRGELAR
jgi:hypothetical protein